MVRQFGPLLGLTFLVGFDYKILLLLLFFIVKISLVLSCLIGGLSFSLPSSFVGSLFCMPVYSFSFSM